MKNLKYVQPKNIETTFEELCREFDICITNIYLANFRDMVSSKVHTEDENKSLKSDQEDLSVVSSSILCLYIYIYTRIL
jgi:hypothetical protein